MLMLLVKCVVDFHHKQVSYTSWMSCVELNSDTVYWDIVRSQR